MALGTRFEAQEIGGDDRRSCDRSTALSAGEVGYVITGLKEVSELRVGDTLTAEHGRRAEPLPGYKDVKPMVFAGLFPTDSDDYPELRDALEKLKLNDAALFYEPETSQALGFGFRCGFLGLLHMEIVRERLEREFDLDLLVTAPNVAYRVRAQNGPSGPRCTTRPTCRTPSTRSRSRTSRRRSSSRRSTSAPVMELCNERRGRFDHMEYLSEDARASDLRAAARRDRARLLRRAQVAHAGYASFDYDYIGFRPGTLVRVDMLVGGDTVDALSLDHPPRRSPTSAAGCSSRSCARRSRGRCSTCRSRRRSARA